MTPAVYAHDLWEIYLQSPDTHLDIQELYNSIAAEQASERGITYRQIAKASGKDNLGGGVFTGITMELLFNWAIEWYAGSYTATIGGGTIVKSGGSGIFTLIPNSPQIIVTQSAAATIVNGNAVTVPSAYDNAQAVLNSVISGTLTLAQSIRVSNAILYGKVSGAGTGVETFRNPEDTKNVCTVTTDINGNRTMVVLDAT